MTPLSAVARLVVAVAASCAIAAPASAGRRVVQQQVGCYTQQAIIQPAYNHVAYPSVTHNFVGLPVRLQAEQAYTMKNDPQWEQFQQWKAAQQQQAMAQALFQQWSAGQQQAAQLNGQPQMSYPPQQQSAAASTCPPGTQCPPATPGATTAPGPLPPVAPGVPNVAQPSLQPHAAKIPLLVEYCGRCHTTEKPAGEFAFDGSVDYTIKGTGPAAEAMAAKRDQILQAIVSQRMPKDGALEPAVAGAIVAELYSDAP